MKHLLILLAALALPATAAAHEAPVAQAVVAIDKTRLDAAERHYAEARTMVEFAADTKTMPFADIVEVREFNAAAYENLVAARYAHDNSDAPGFEHALMLLDLNIRRMRGFVTATLRTLSHDQD